MMKDIIFLINLFFIIFIFQSTVHAQSEALARLWGVNDDALPTMLETERNLKKVDGILNRVINNSDFGGTWIDVKANKVFINTLSTANVSYITSLPGVHPYVDLLNFTIIDNSTDKLSDSFEQIIKLAKKYIAVDVYLYVDISLNNIVIYLEQSKSDPKNSEFINATDQYYPILIYQPPDPPTTKQQSTMKLYNNDKRQIDKVLLCGEGIYRGSRTEIDYSCSIGFFAKLANNSDVTYAVTTGHCYTDRGSNIFYYFPWGDRPDGTLLGVMDIHRVEDYDYGLIGLKRRGIRPLPMIRNTDANEYKQLQIRDTKPVSNHGAHLCKSGHTTHATCEYIKAFDGIFIDSESFATELIINDMEGDIGDSGGAAYYYYENLYSVNLSGIHTGGNKGIGSILPLQIILDETKIVPILVNE
ncbi:hypothetical protein C2G38_2033273 [Gigaspora rosea]|uniref:Peptidase S1 domain-containing protein n=1 Tax=Gigaspora rosea TaxID=44941 RepID=A0A397VK41_9GLOM|nr:hypothetical protein C2G38_2033273 [Gigaspora rosea]